MTASTDDVDFAARAFVCGMRDAIVREGHRMQGKRILATGEWAPRFMGHPWVRQSEAEGWARELRMHCIREVRTRIAAGQAYQNLTDLMPDAATVKHWSDRAAAYSDGARWREFITEQFGSVDAYLGKGKRLPRNWSQAGKSKRMTGERD